MLLEALLFNSSNVEKPAEPVSANHIPKGDVFNSVIIKRSGWFKFNGMKRSALYKE